MRNENRKVFSSKDLPFISDPDPFTIAAVRPSSVWEFLTSSALRFHFGLSPCSSAVLMCWSYRHLQQSSSLSNMVMSRGYCSWKSLANRGRSSKLPNISSSCKDQIVQSVNAFVCRGKAGRDNCCLDLEDVFQSRGVFKRLAEDGT